MKDLNGEVKFCGNEEQLTHNAQNRFTCGVQIFPSKHNAQIIRVEQYAFIYEMRFPNHTSSINGYKLEPLNG